MVECKRMKTALKSSYPVKNWLQRTCQRCQVEFWIVPSQVKHGGGHFCSKVCTVGDPVSNFWRKVTKDGGLPKDCPELGICWRWHGSASGTFGYGHLKNGKDYPLAHRFSWEIHFGTVPDGLQVNHKCDNPECTNPVHLQLGTQGDNMRQCHERGRFVGNSKAKREAKKLLIDSNPVQV